MIEAKTALIVGAGAGVPYGYPTGLQLRKELCDPDKLTDLNHTHHLVQERGIELFCQDFKASQLFSIDAFLAKRGEDSIGKQPGVCQTFGNYGNVGKYAIACRLMEREINQAVLPEPDEDHWLQYLWNRMSDVPKTQFQDNQLKIISFNYDRVIEQYFQAAIENAYGITPSEATNLRKSVEIVHVYGSMQELEDRPYGSEGNLMEIADCIKVIPEARNEDDVQFKRAKEIIGWADKICFIGFGFDSINISRLGFPHHDLSSKGLIYCTQFGMTVGEIKAVHKLLGGNFKWNIKTEFNKLKTLAYIRHEGVFLSL